MCGARRQVRYKSLVARAGQARNSGAGASATSVRAYGLWSEVEPDRAAGPSVSTSTDLQTSPWVTGLHKAWQSPPTQPVIGLDDYTSLIAMDVPRAEASPLDSTS